MRYTKYPKISFLPAVLILVIITSLKNSFVQLTVILAVGFVIYRVFVKCKNIKTYEMDLGYIDKMKGVEFERFLAKLYRNFGYKVLMTPASGDYGADLVLIKDNQKICVQAKRYSSNIGVAAVQEVLGSLKYYNASSGIVVTNMYFTPNAIKLANANNITLIDRKKLIFMLNKIKNKASQTPA